MRKKKNASKIWRVLTFLAIVALAVGVGLAIARPWEKKELETLKDQIEVTLQNEDDQNEAGEFAAQSEQGSSDVEENAEENVGDQEENVLGDQDDVEIEAGEEADE